MSSLQVLCLDNLAPNVSVCLSLNYFQKLKHARSILYIIKLHDAYAVYTPRVTSLRQYAHGRRLRVAVCPIAGRHDGVQCVVHVL
jgi:hypothetical protein